MAVPMSQSPDGTLPAVIFDLDGVIVDSEIWWHQERVAWAAALGLVWSEADSRAVMGANSRGWATIMRQRMGLPVSDEPEIEAEIVRRVVGRYASGAPVIPGSVDAVRRTARNHPVAIASSAHRAVIDAALGATGLAEDNLIIVSSDEVDHGKPAPDVYLEAARRLGVDPADCLVVEDSINGVRAGLAAGMTVVLIPNVAVPPDPEARVIAHVVIERLADLEPAGLVPRAAPSLAGESVV